MTRSIESRLIIVFGLLILMVMFISSFFIVDRVKNYFYEDMQKKIEFMVSSSLTKVLGDNSLGISQIQDIIDQSMKESQYGFMINKLVVTDAQGKLVASFPRMNLNFFPSDDILNALAGDKTITRDEERQVLAFSFPIKSKDRTVIRVLHLEVSTHNVYVTVEDIKNILIMAYIVSIAFSMLIGLMFAKTLSNPIKKLTKRALEMAQGKLDVEIDISSNDEIGKLSNAFAEMAENIKKYISELEMEKQKLERILQNMSDGIIALSSKAEIVHINGSARRLLGDNMNSFLESAGMLDTNIYKTDEFILEISKTTFVDSYQQEGQIFIIHDITEQARLDEMRRQFVANVSHELRTPITTIKTYSETLLDVDDNQTKSAFLSVIIKECDRMTRLVSDLLYLSRLDAGERILNFEECDLSELLRFVCEKLKIHAQKKNQTLVCSISKEVIGLVDRDKIEQVLINIINNAITYVQEGGKIEVSLFEENGYAKFIIKDNGPGIPKEDLPRIFERFYRVDKARSRELGGSGLGLSIADEIVKAHKGKILVESDLNVGTTFVIILPLQRDHLYNSSKEI